MTLPVDLERLLAELDHLAQYSETPPPAVTRILFTPPDLEAKAYLTGLFQEAGLKVRTDPVGNIFASWSPSGATGAPVATGSHIDAIPHSGRFDGTVGVLGGLEAIRMLMRSGFQPERPIELVCFAAEEPTRFGVGCLGSRALCGAIAANELAELRDGQGQRFDDVRRRAGLSGPLDKARVAPRAYRAFVELHIEQGPLLERNGIPIGAVTAIAAPSTLRIVVQGEGGHAGAVLMRERKDALVAAAEMALAVECIALKMSPDTVGTVGLFEVFPGAVNSIPEKVSCTVDLRDIDAPRRDQALDEILTEVRAIACRRGVSVSVERLNADPPVTCAREVVAAIEEACTALNLRHLPMVSRAYHDALFMARIAPTGMIFIPCRDGVSHRPDEYAAPEAIERGVRVLAETLRRLAST